jgi:hypothetical protein
MVRAGVVSHPRQWEWTGYREIMGQRKRNRLLTLGSIRLGVGDGRPGSRAKEVGGEPGRSARARAVRREPCWTETLVVGSPGFVGRMQPLIRSRQETEIVEAVEGIWALREARSSLRQRNGTEKRAMAWFFTISESPSFGATAICFGDSRPSRQNHLSCSRLPVPLSPQPPRSCQHDSGKETLIGMNLPAGQPTYFRLKFHDFGDSGLSGTASRGTVLPWVTIVRVRCFRNRRRGAAGFPSAWCATSRRKWKIGTTNAAS